MEFSSYRNKKVLLTGHTGFKGSWLAIWLKKLGAEVIGFSKDPYTKKDIFNQTQLGKKIIDIRGDICNIKEIEKVIEKYQPEVVFHLAAQPIVRLSYDDPYTTFNSNAIGTLNLLEGIRKSSSVKAGVFITTDKVYVNNESVWGYRENEPLGGYDPYSASKACAEIIISSYRNSFFKTSENIKIASARAGNVIGGGDWQVDRILPDCINALVENKPINIRNPDATRPWQHVLDALSGYLLIGEKLLGSNGLQFADAWNFGPLYNSIITVKELVEIIIEKWGSGNYTLANTKKSEKHEAKLLSLDITKAINLLQWTPVLNLQDSIELTLDWYKYQQEHPQDDMYDYCLKQIDFFTNIMVKKKEHKGDISIGYERRHF
jgi:CDP-glucose 4,6-dehydratase